MLEETIGVKMTESKKMATGPLKNSEKTYIKRYKDKGSEYLSKKLKRRLETVEKYLNELNAVEVQEKKIEEKQNNIVDNLFAKKKDRGVVVMTEAASSYLDEKKNRPKKSIFDLPYVHKIRKDD